MRSLYLAGSLYIAFSGLVLLQSLRQPSVYRHPDGAVANVPYSGPAGAWFQMTKPFCNSLEVEIRLEHAPPPTTLEGVGFAAACLALAGKIDHARNLIRQAPDEEQWKAAGIVFNVGHPVADAGDDKSAGPIMELVIEFWPNHYMALYHAGASAYILGQHDRARLRMEQFLSYYELNDGWRRNALAVLERLGDT
jgi:hypothetical protein